MTRTKGRIYAEDMDLTEQGHLTTTVCHECAGRGFKVIERMALFRVSAWAYDGPGMALGRGPDCPLCEGEGALPGIVPPM